MENVTTKLERSAITLMVNETGTSNLYVFGKDVSIGVMSVCIRADAEQNQLIILTVDNEFEKSLEKKGVATKFKQLLKMSQKGDGMTNISLVYTDTEEN